MKLTPDVIRQRAERTLATCLRGLIQAVVALIAGIPLIVFSVLSIAFIALGVGVLVAPQVLLLMRGYARTQRAWAAEWSGVRIDDPYQPAPEFSTGLIGQMQKLKWLLNDPATWRDFLFTFINIPVGLFFGLLPLVLVGYGIVGIIVGLVGAFVTPVLDLAFGPHWIAFVLAIPVGLALIPVGVALGPGILRQHANFVASLLAPSRDALEARVDRLTETRAQVVDASAAELRRIERDLHDGAQARLAALGMNIGLAEQLIRNDPDAALALLTEARESSTEALAELRNLVRGIHPPVLADRGLDGAIQALALRLPLPVEVEVALDGEGQPGGRLSAPVESAAYFAIAEALANVVKHSHARSAWVRARHESGSLIVSIGDDGVGGAAVGSGGLRGVEKRLAAFDGTMFLASPIGGPTVLTLEIPCELSSART